MCHLQHFYQLSQRAACRAVRSHTSLVHALVRLHRNSLHHLPHDVLKSLADGLIGCTSPLGIPASHSSFFMAVMNCTMASAPSWLQHRP